MPLSPTPDCSPPLYAILSHSQLFTPALCHSLPLPTVDPRSMPFSPTPDCSPRPMPFSPNPNCSPPPYAILSHSRLFTSVYLSRYLSPSILMSAFLLSFCSNALFVNNSSLNLFVRPALPQFSFSLLVSRLPTRFPLAVSSTFCST